MDESAQRDAFTIESLITKWYRCFI